MDNRTLLTQKNVIKWKTRFLYNDWQNPLRKCMFTIRFILIVVVIGLCVANALTGIALPLYRVDCIWDGLHVATAPANEYFREHMTVRDVLITSSSMLIDVLLLHFSYRYVLWGHTWKPVLVLFCFYLLRGVTQAIFIMEFPFGFNFTYPGVPSIAVPYPVSSDFYFSGHVGIATIFALENHSSNKCFMAGLGLFCVIFEFIVMIVLRAHYTIDLFAGIVFAHYLWIILDAPAKWVDKFLGYNNK